MINFLFMILFRISRENICFILVSSLIFLSRTVELPLLNEKFKSFFQNSLSSLLFKDKPNFLKKLPHILLQFIGKVGGLIESYIKVLYFI